MKKPILLLSILALAFLGVVQAGEGSSVTLEGKILCAKCTMHEDGADKCQNVLVVESDGEAVHYYMTKNDVYEKFGSICKGAKAARVTGTVAERDGHKWIDAKDITPLEVDEG